LADFPKINSVTPGSLADGIFFPGDIIKFIKTKDGTIPINNDKKSKDFFRQIKDHGHLIFMIDRDSGK
jgi:hypothetical protein